MRHTLLVTKVALLLLISGNLLRLLIATAAVACAEASTFQESQSVPVLDLTAKVPPEEQGYYHGIPGSSGGGATGGWRPGPDDTVQYALPLKIQILRATTNAQGDFVLEVSLQNTGDASFDFPNSPKLTTVERPGNKTRHVFFFQVRPLDDRKPDTPTVGFAATASSTSIAGSFTRLEPGKSLRVMLLASSDLIRRSLGGAAEKLAVRVVCNEWRIDDDRFFLKGESAELASENSVQFDRRGEQIIPAQP